MHVTKEPNLQGREGKCEEGGCQRTKNSVMRNGTTKSQFSMKRILQKRLEDSGGEPIVRKQTRVS